VVPRKAYDVLVRALALHKQRDWRLAVVGPTDRSAEALADVLAAIADTALADRVALVGPVSQDALARYYAAADVFLMPSLYEGYGMVLAEAMARGLPIVCTTGGAAAETVPDGAAIKVAPADERALGEAIGRLLADAGQRRRMADASWAAAQRLPGWEDTARVIAGVIAEVAR
jgi:glycosyltransferase involved in cell wall biosynthesis